MQSPDLQFQTLNCLFQLNATVSTVPYCSSSVTTSSVHEGQVSGLWVAGGFPHKNYWCRLPLGLNEQFNIYI